MNRTTILLPLLCVVTASCASKNPLVATGTLTTAQARAIDSAASEIPKLVADHSVTYWRRSVEQHTNALVAGGNTNLASVLALVCELTAEEEAKARETRRALTKAFSKLNAQATKDYGGKETQELYQQFMLDTEKMTVDMTDKSFTQSRDQLIEKYYREAIERTPNKILEDTGTSAPDPQD